jgi:prepilin-type N-terminal cleavage/methylation domain-containing protein
MAKRVESGLTLLEIIIALSIAAIIFSVLLWALRLGYSSVEKGTEREEKSQRMRILADRLTWLLRGTYPHIARTPEGNVLYFAGTSDSVGFVTTSVDPYADTLQDSAGLKWVTIFADSEGLKMQEDIYFAEVFEDEPREEYLFDPTVTGIEFEYLDPGDEGTEAEWVESWDPEEEEYLPSAVKIYLTFEHKEEEVEMPPIVVALKTGQVLGERQKPPASP